MSEPRKVNTGEGCLVCGNELVLFTTAPQDGKHTWCAYDGDVARCFDCGFEAWASIDSEDAYITWDETSEHNVKVQEKFDKRR